MMNLDKLEDAATVEGAFVGRTASRWFGDMSVPYGIVAFDGDREREVRLDDGSSLFRAGLIVPGARLRGQLFPCRAIPPGEGRDLLLDDIQLLSDPQAKIEATEMLNPVERLWKSNDIFTPGEKVKGRIQRYLSMGDFVGEPPVALGSVTFARKPLFGPVRYIDARAAFPRDRGATLAEAGASFTARIGKSPYAGAPPYRGPGTIFTLEKLVTHPYAAPFAPSRLDENANFQRGLHHALLG